MDYQQREAIPNCLPKSKKKPDENFNSQTTSYMYISPFMLPQRKQMQFSRTTAVNEAAPFDFPMNPTYMLRRGPKQRIYVIMIKILPQNAGKKTRKAAFSCCLLTATIFALGSCQKSSDISCELRGRAKTSTQLL